MRDIKQIELTLESPDYSWHIAESDRETWVILRNKKRLEACLITAITGITLERFTWDIFLQEKEKRLYKGMLSLFIKCAITNMSDIRSAFPDAAYEEGLSRELFIRAEKASFPQYQRKEGHSRLFADVLLDGAETRGFTKEEMDIGIMIDAPWQAWLYGEGKTVEPELIKVHATQTGLSSVLLEAVIKLEVHKEEVLTNPTRTNTSFIMKDETILNIKDNEIDEVIGIAERTAFYANYHRPGAENIILESFKKTSVIYISPQTAQERIMVASVISREQKEITSHHLPSVCPVGFQLSKRSRKIVRDFTKKVVYQNEVLYTLDYETKKEDITEEVIPKLESMSAVSAVIPMPLVRQKPGEKYFKKSGLSKTAKDKSKGIYVISLKK